MPGAKNFRSFVSHIDKDFPTIDEFVKSKNKPREDKKPPKARSPKVKVARNASSMNRNNEGLTRINEIEMKQANALLAQEREE